MKGSKGKEGEEFKPGSKRLIRGGERGIVEKR